MSVLWHLWWPWSADKALYCFVSRYGFQELKENLKKDFKVSAYTKVCSEHFRWEDFVSFDTKSWRLKAGACPSFFSWLKRNPERSLPEKKKQIKELNAILESELTATSSEGEGKFHLTDNEDFVSRVLKLMLKFCPITDFSVVRVLLDLGDTQAREKNYFNHLTWFNSYTKFQGILKFVLPGGERERISYSGIHPCYLIQMKNLHKAMAVIQTQTLALKEITYR